MVPIDFKYCRHKLQKNLIPKCAQLIATFFVENAEFFLSRSFQLSILTIRAGGR